VISPLRICVTAIAEICQVSHFLKLRSLHSVKKVDISSDASHPVTPRNRLNPKLRPITLCSASNLHLEPAYGEAVMEKMFVYPETCESIDSTMTLESNNTRSTTADVLSYRSKLYRTLLDQGAASRNFRLAQAAQQEPSNCAHA